MATPGRTPALIVSGLIVVLAIIHLGVGSGIVSKYHQYQDVFRPSVGLAAFDIIVSIYSLAIGVLCLFTIIKQSPALSKIAAICVLVVGIVSIASLIAALVINSQAVSYVRGRLSYRMNSYIETDSSINIMDAIQTRYQCCGENLWLDWSRVGLGSTATTGTGTNTGTVTNTGTGTGTVTNTGTGTGTVVTSGRRRRHLNILSSVLVKAVRRRRQTAISAGSYGLPSTYTFNLPLSCCKSGGTSSGNQVGGYCVYSAGNSSTNFYVEGCIPPVANIMVLQITGIAIINLCLGILAFVLIPILIKMFPTAYDPNNPNNKQHLSDQSQQQQQQQYQNGAYYVANPNPNSNPDPNAYAYYNYSQPAYVTYQ